MKRLLYLFLLLAMQIAFINMVFTGVSTENSRPKKVIQDTIDVIYQTPNTTLVKK